MESARALKREVLTLLESYAAMITGNQLRQVRKSIPEDSKRISLKLEELISASRRCVKECREVETIVKLVKDFLRNFEGMRHRYTKAHTTIE